MSLKDKTQFNPYKSCSIKIFAGFPIKIRRNVINSIFVISEYLSVLNYFQTTLKLRKIAGEAPNVVL